MGKSYPIQKLPIILKTFGLKLENISDNVNELTENTNRVLVRSAVLDDVLLELRDTH